MLLPEPSIPENVMSRDFNIHFLEKTSREFVLMPRTIRYVRGARRRKSNHGPNCYPRARQESKLNQQRSNLPLLRGCDCRAGGLRSRAPAHFDGRRYGCAARRLGCLSLWVGSLRRRLRRRGVLRPRCGRSWIVREFNRRLHGARRRWGSLGRRRLLGHLLLGHQRLCRATHQNQKASCHPRHNSIHSCSSKLPG